MNATTVVWLAAIVGVGLSSYLMGQRNPKPAPCPNGAIGQLISPDGTTYCSYVHGRYNPEIQWRKI
jgi:hypothetical protein